jgi:hypothetical protein
MITRACKYFSQDQFQLPEASVEDMVRQRAEYEQAAKHGQETRDALIRSASADLLLSRFEAANAHRHAVATCAEESYQ